MAALGRILSGREVQRRLDEEPDSLTCVLLPARPVRNEEETLERLRWPESALALRADAE
jgi:hypothetical protein